MVVASGLGPLILEYIDSGTLGAMVREFGLELGVPDAVRNATKAYAVVMMENRNEALLEEDVHELAVLLSDLGAIDVYVLPSASGQRLIEACEKAFWLAKGAGADDIIDIVVPRARLGVDGHVGEIAEESGAFIAGCGHAGDGNIHLSVYKPDAEERSKVLHALFEVGVGVRGRDPWRTRHRHDQTQVLSRARGSGEGRPHAVIKAVFDPTASSTRGRSSVTVGRAGLGLQGFPRAPEGVDLLSHYRASLEMVPPEFTSVWIQDHLQFGRGDTLLEGWNCSRISRPVPRFLYGNLGSARATEILPSSRRWQRRWSTSLVGVWCSRSARDGTTRRTWPTATITERYARGQQRELMK